MNNTPFKPPPSPKQINDRLAAIASELAKYPNVKALVAEQEYLKSIPQTAKEINDRMKEIGAELAKFRGVPHPRQKELSAELDHLESIYDGVLKAGGVNHS